MTYKRCNWQSNRQCNIVREIVFVIWDISFNLGFSDVLGLGSGGCNLLNFRLLDLRRLLICGRAEYNRQNDCEDQENGNSNDNWKLLVEREEGVREWSKME